MTQTSHPSPLDALVSTFAHAKATTPKAHSPLRTVLQDIQRGTQRARITRLRAMDRANNKDAYKAAKEKLLAFTPCCDMKTRAKDVLWPDKLLSCSGLVHFDYDYLQDPEALKTQLTTDPYCCFAFVSPGGAGVKVGFAAYGIINTDTYKHIWRAFGAYLKTTYPDRTFTEDQNVKYLNALCFVSYDPELFLRNDPEVFTAPPSSSSSSPSSRSSSSFPPSSSSDYDRVADALDSVAGVDDYDTWMRVGMALCSTRESYARDLWDRWSQKGEKYDEHDQESTWNSFTPDGAVTIATVFKLAKDAGWYDQKRQQHTNGSRHVPQMGQGQGKVQPVGVAVDGDTATVLGTVSPCTHQANARRIARDYAGRLRYALGSGWLIWTGQFWRMDPTTEGALATGVVGTLSQTIATEAQSLLSFAGAETEPDKRKALLALAEQRLKWAIQSESERVIAAGLKLAKNALLLEHHALDAHPWTFNCTNGTLDLRTSVLHEHDPTQLLTHLAPVAFNPEATCPTWESFLLEVFAGDQEMVDFLQRALGWCLTGIVKERALFFLYGATGHNGKTTVVETFAALLGACGENSPGYARKVDASTFMKSKYQEDNQRKAAMLVGPRFIYSSEVDEDHRLNEQLIKDITGGDTLEGRRLFKEAFTFKPTFKTWLYGNHKPEIRELGDALWGRVKMVDFPVSFADRIDTTLPGKLDAERAGILNWALKGCRAWQQRGLSPPQKVLATTQAYREEMDIFGPFLRECCVLHSNATVKSAMLYAHYKQWCEELGHKPVSHTRLGRYLTAKGYVSDDNSTGRGAIRSGIGLRQSSPQDGDAPATCSSAPATCSSATGSSAIANKDAIKTELEGAVLPVATYFPLSSPKDTLLRTPSGKQVVTDSKEGGAWQETRVNTYDAPATCLPATGSTVAATGSTLVAHHEERVRAPQAIGGATSPAPPETVNAFKRLRCPQCGATGAILGGEGRRVCQECPHGWTPAGNA